MNRAAWFAGLSLAAFAALWPAPATAVNGGGWSTSFIDALGAPDRPPAARKTTRKSRRDRDKPAENLPPVPPGQLHVVVSLDPQRVTLFANGAPVIHSKISSGTDSNPTQMGVFTVIQKNRHHVSNLYDAEMPYMQRLTWSGTALHQGPLPGYPASHGCIRLTPEFAQLLWKTTRIGARVIITRGEAAPVEIAHPRLFVPRPRTAETARDSIPAAAYPATAAPLVKTADATGAIAVTVMTQAGEQPPPLPPAPAGVEPSAVRRPPVQAQPVADNSPPPFVPAPEMTAEPAGPPAASAIQRTSPAKILGVPSIMVDEFPSKSQRPLAARAVRKNATVSVFVSRKEGKLYVRHGMEPLFETPVAIEQPDRPIGTHVYTAMEPMDGGPALRWTVISIPSKVPPIEQPQKTSKKSKSGSGKPHQAAKPAIKPAEIDTTPASGPGEALDRIELPPAAVERIAELVAPGSSLIISDNRLSGETGKTTDFIVLTQ